MSIEDRHRLRIANGVKRVIAVQAACLAVVACSAEKRDFDDGPQTQSGGAGGNGSPAGTGGSGGSGGATEPTVCPETHACVVPPADGWSGPVISARGQPFPDCTPLYPDVALDARRALSAGPTECGCGCNPPAIDCGQPQLMYRMSCGQPVTPSPIPGAPGECVPMTPRHNSASPFFSPAAAPCAPAPQTSIPAPVFDDSVRLCSGAVDHGGCEGTLRCVPKPSLPYEKVCVYQSGPHPCPPGYPDRSDYYAGVNDTRSCSECTCGEPTGVQCTTTIYPFGDAACATPSSTPAATGGCSASSPFVRYDPPASAGACAPAAVNPVGSIELSDAYTVCCAD